MNKVIFSGELGADPVVKELQSGRLIAKFNIAVVEKNEMIWVSCEGWDEIAEITQASLKKNDYVLVEGKFRVEKWSEDGQKKIKYIVRMNRIEKL